MRRMQYVPAQQNAEFVAAMIYARAGIAAPPPRVIVRPVKAGRFDFKGGYFTLPEWLWLDQHGKDCSCGQVPPPDYVEWYIAHELAHGLLGAPGHGVPFQLLLWMLAPDAWHWETTYKPHCYAAARPLVYGAGL